MAHAGVVRAITIAVLVAVTSIGCARPPLSAPGATVRDSYRRLPLHFEENRGQADPDARYVARTATGTILLTPAGLVLALEGQRVIVSFGGDAPHPNLEAVAPLPGRVNYYVGRDPKGWRTDIPTYGRVRYPHVYPGIEVVVYGNQQRLEYDFVVAPGADPEQIRLHVKGAERLTLAGNGDLHFVRGGRAIVQRAPALYQERDGRREPVAGRYLLPGPNEIAFAVGSYDRTRPLIIDPQVVYSTRIGVGVGRNIAIDASGFVYVTGENAVPGGAGYPTVNPAFPHQGNGFEDIFVTKLSPNGDSLVYSTFIGSFWRDFVNGIGVDAEGNAYITGAAHNDFPTTPGAFQPTAIGGEEPTTPFVAKFSPAGALLYSTFLSGTTFDGDPVRGNNCFTGSANGIAVDAAGHAYVTGVTRTTNFPTTPGAYKSAPPAPPAGSTCFAGGGAWVTKLAPDGASLVYSSYMDGAGSAIAVTVFGEASVTGPLDAVPFPVTTLAANGSQTGGAVVMLDATGLPIHGTVIGPVADSIVVGGDGTRYVSGTGATNFVASNEGFQQTPPGGLDAFAGRLNSTGTAWLWSTYVGGSGADTITGIAADANSESAWLVGSTDSVDFPTKAELRAKAAATEIVALRLSKKGKLLFSTFLGDGNGNGIALDPAGSVYLIGFANADFATTPGAFNTTPSGSPDVFVLKLTD